VATYDRHYGRVKPPLHAKIDWAHPLADKLTNMWSFREGAGSIIHNDVPNGLEGMVNTLTTGFWKEAAPGEEAYQHGVGRAVFIDAIAQRIELDDTAIVINEDDPFTVSALCRPDTEHPTFAGLLALRTDTSNMLEIFASRSSSYTHFSFGISGVIVRRDGLPAASEDNKWKRITITYTGGGFGDSNHWRMYLDSEEIAHVSSSGYSNRSEQNRIGSVGSDSRQWDGDIAEVRTYARELTPADVREMTINPYGIYLMSPIVLGFSPLEAGEAAEGTGRGHLEASSTKTAISDPAEGTGRGTAEAVSTKNVEVNAETTGQGTTQAFGPKIRLASAEVTSQGTAQASGFRAAFPEGTGRGHIETVSVKQVEGNAAASAQATGEAISVKNVVADGQATAQATAESSSVKQVTAQVEVAAQGAADAQSIFSVSASVEVTAQGHGEAVMFVVANARLAGAQGHIEAVSTKTAVSVGVEVTAQGHGEASGEAISVSTVKVSAQAHISATSSSYQLSPTGRKPIGPDQPPHGANSNYPFVKLSTDIQKMLGDFYLSYDDPDCEYALPFRIAWMAGFGSLDVPEPPGFPTKVHKKDLLVVDANDKVVFDSTKAIDYVEIPWAGRLESIEWTTNNKICRVTRHTAFKPGDTPIFYDTFITPENGQLDERTYRANPRRVTSFKVGLVTVKAENVIWDEGFNLSMTPQDPVSAEGGRRVQPIVFTARPGDGIGRVPACEDVDPLVRRINNIQPDGAGNFVLDTSGCYRIQRPTQLVNDRPRTVELGHPDLTAEQAAAAIQVFNDCGPCCECDDFVNTYEGVRRLENRYFGLGQRAEAARDQYALNLARWNAGRDCRINNPFRLVVQQEYGCTVALGLNHCNLTEGCIRPLYIRLTLQVYKDGVIDPSVTATTFVCPETVRNGTDTGYEDDVYEMAGTYPVFDTKFGLADPQQPAKLRTRLKFSGCDNGHALKITMSAHYEDVLKDDGTPANTPPVLTPGGDIATLWDGADDELPPARAIVQDTVALTLEDPCR